MSALCAAIAIILIFRIMNIFCKRAGVVLLYSAVACAFVFHALLLAEGLGF